MFPSCVPHVIVGVLALAVGAGLAAETCVVDGELRYCDYGCCTGECCGLSNLAIVGLIVGAVFSFAAIAGCIICLACMCKQSGSNHVHPVPHNSNSVYVNTGSTPYHPPPSYNNYSSYPGNSDYDPVYPPGSTGTHPPPAYTYSNPSSRKY